MINADIELAKKEAFLFKKVKIPKSIENFQAFLKNK